VCEGIPWNTSSFFTLVILERAKDSTKEIRNKGREREVQPKPKKINKKQRITKTKSFVVTSLTLILQLFPFLYF
jgi:hypothetical protein